MLGLVSSEDELNVAKKENGMRADGAICLSWEKKKNLSRKKNLGRNLFKKKEGENISDLRFGGENRAMWVKIRSGSLGSSLARRFRGLRSHCMTRDECR